MNHQINNSINSISGLIQQPLPLQPRTIQGLKSILSFTIPSSQFQSAYSFQMTRNKNCQKEFLYEEPNGIYSNFRNVHQIGSNFVQIFQKPIFQNTPHIELVNNKSFARWSGSLSSIEKQFKGQTICENESKSSILFQSKFQSGNLALVAKSAKMQNQYNLCMTRDFNSSKGEHECSTQWFFFRAKLKQPENQHQNKAFRFNIVNFTKPYSSFRHGMKISLLEPQKSKEWIKGGQNIQYRKNSVLYDENKHYYSLSFSYSFPKDVKEVYFAYSAPYTYTRLNNMLKYLQQKFSDRIMVKTLCKTLNGNNLYQVNITNPQNQAKKSIFITARVHPGQTVSSFLCQNMIRFLVSDQHQAQKLRDQFIIKIVPMLNPDGVINGNYRTSLSGSDLNRVWKNPDSGLHPQIYNAKKSILQSNSKKLVLYVDLHGHSKKKASFMYGCTSQNNPYISKQFPYLLSKKSKNFNYFNCNFNICRQKQGTSRIAIYRQFNLIYSYTFQISLCGPSFERRHFNWQDFQQMASDFCKSTYEYFYSHIQQNKINKKTQELIDQFYKDEQLINIGNQQTDGSSSELQDAIVLDKEQIFYQNKIKRQKMKRNASCEAKSKRNLQHTGFSFRNRLPFSPNESKDLKRSTNLGFILQKLQNSVQLPQKLDANINKKKEIFIKRSSLNTSKVMIQDNGLQYASRSFYFQVYKEKKQKQQSMKNSNFRINSNISNTQQQDYNGILLPVVSKQYGKYQRHHRRSLKYKRNQIKINIRPEVNVSLTYRQRTNSCQRPQISLKDRIKVKSQIHSSQPIKINNKLSFLI